MKDILERPCWTSAILGVRTGERETGRVCGNDENEKLPHPNITIAMSLHGYPHQIGFRPFFCCCLYQLRAVICFRMLSIFVLTRSSL